VVECDGEDHVGANAPVHHVAIDIVEQIAVLVDEGVDKRCLCLGSQLTLTAKALPANAVNRTIKWVSGDKTVVKVSSKGVVTPVATGTAKVFAKTANGTKAYCTVTVVRPPVASIKLSKTKGSMNVGKKSTLTATVSPSNAANPEITWTSSNRKVAAVSKTGVVTAVGRGECTITASTKNGVSASCKLTVKQPVTKLTLTKTAAKVKKGKTVKLSVLVAPENASNKKVSWISGNSKIATVDANGVVKGIKKGQATITVVAMDGSGKTATCIVTVK
ncbi:MAG: Ig-like domain-containing protein, partial [Lachnospiraceae bacterium]